ncbi:hypothetical protein [Micromonospora coxensis]|uniref:Uncharacterized protein n=1 Tax=Micromonospora coxensis TaxID=356852 RepID=A0A1C5J3X4_9ACTN|nr:hypothetical protein [Micromonospora coxensis]SCG65265.1 hypothetical protein GA0070614_3926 [Micromonospora coxensis]
MSDVIAVALIASLSTLLGAGLSGFMGLRIARQQIGGQVADAREARSAQRRATRDALRRDAYVRFLSACDHAYRQLDQRWRESESQAPAAGYDDVYAAVRAVDEAYNLILLEGPAAVATAGARVVESVNAENATLRQLVNAAPATGVPPVARHTAERRELIGARIETRDAFVDAARAALAD